MTDEEIRASVLDNLSADTFLDEAELQAYLRLQPAAQRAEKVADACGVRLGMAARYVEAFCLKGAP